MCTATSFAEVPVLLRGETAAVAPWTEAPAPARVALWLAVTIGGSAAFGAAMGWWRAPEQALYTATKLPLVLLFTALGNTLGAAIRGGVSPERVGQVHAAGAGTGPQERH
ncbi:hypothetical protein LBMAG56_35200 [Verrucomicrobiota bacterium]|nr:hypothetical protein LBMAG56_35200 [Verrucomicrobiota bacterium]